jgi:hypothetical protein
MTVTRTSASISLVLGLSVSPQRRIVLRRNSLSPWSLSRETNSLSWQNNHSRRDRRGCVGSTHLREPRICGKGNSMKIKALVGAVLLAGLFTACGNSNTTKASNLTGTWTFAAQSMPFNLALTGSATIQQTNQALMGAMTLIELPCGTIETLQGSFVNNEVTLQLFSGSTLIILTGNFNKDGSLSGKYTTNGDFGTWKAVRGPYILCTA